MDGKNDWAIRRQFAQPRQDVQKRIPIVHIRRPVQSEERITSHWAAFAIIGRARSKIQTFQYGRSLCFLLERKERVNHCVAHEMNGFGSDPLVSEIPKRTLFGRKKQVADMIGKNAV